MTNETGFRFIIKHPSEKVQAFLMENASQDWEQTLTYLLDNYPQHVDGKVVWVLSGGAAIHLRHPERAIPGDIDVITRSKQMAIDFQSSLVFDVKDTETWADYHRVTYDETDLERLFGEASLVSFQNRRVIALTDTALAAEKSSWLGGEPPKRDKDITDLKILSVPSEIASTFLNNLGFRNKKSSNNVYVQAH